MRPKLITILCLFLFLTSIFLGLGATLAFVNTSEFTALIGIGTSVLLLGSAVGLWKMRRWGPILFAILMIAMIVLAFGYSPSGMVPTNADPWPILFVPVVYFVIVLPYWKLLNSDRSENEEADSGL